MKFIQLKLKIALIVLLSGLGSWCNTTPSYGGCIWINDVTVQPTNPTNIDFVQISVTGELCEDCSWEISSSHVVQSNTIILNISIVPQFQWCFHVITPWSITEPISYLSTGNYDVQVFINRILYVTMPLVVRDACECDLNHDGRCDMEDWLMFGQDWGRTDCHEPGVDPCECDLNDDGTCDMEDWLFFGEDWGRTDCPERLD